MIFIFGVTTYYYRYLYLSESRRTFIDIYLFHITIKYRHIIITIGYIVMRKIETLETGRDVL